MGLTNSFFWSFVERFGTVLLTFFFNWLLSRFFLTPSDFGVIGMLYVFIALANATVIGGFGQALIQKKTPTDKDYNTVFLWNVVLGLVLYLLLYISSPFIATYYSEPRLISILRVLSLTLILNSLFVVQNNLLVKNLDFNKLAKINLASSFFGYIGGTILAYKGYGVWSLVANTLLIQFFQVIFLWISSTWKPKIEFDKESFKNLFSFGGFMYLSSLLENLYNNFSYLVIGRLFNSTTLGYFTQAEKLQNVPANTISNVINQVSFPLFSSLQGDDLKLRSLFKKNISLAAFIMSFIMLLLVLIAKPLVLFLFSMKWESSILYFQILCFSGILLPINTANATIIKSVGKGKLYFSLQLAKRLIGILSMLLGALISIEFILYAICLSSVVFLIINGIATANSIPYSLWEQCYDIFRSIFIPLLVFFVFFINLSIITTNYYFLDVVICTLLYLLTVGIISYIFKLKSFFILLNILKSYIKH